MRYPVRHARSDLTGSLRGYGWKWDQWFWWNGWGWNKRALIGFVPFVNRAWRPDIAPSTVRHFQFHLTGWGARRGVRANQVYVNMNSGSIVPLHDGGFT